MGSNLKWATYRGQRSTKQLRARAAGPSATLDPRKRYRCLEGCGLRFKTAEHTRACPRCNQPVQQIGDAE